MRNMKLYFTCLFFLIGLHLSAQKNNTINYLNQKPPGMVAEVFAPGILTTNKYEHSAPAFSPDGSRVLWAIADKGTYLLEMKYENGVWSKPARPSFADTTANTEVYPSFSADEKKLYFSSNRKMPKGFPQDGKNRIWEVALTPGGWGEPMPFDTTASQGLDYANSISKSGAIYFSSGIREGTNWNIRKSEKINGVYTKPVLLPYNINSVGYEDGAYISPDESFLIFESDRADGTNGFISLFISFKNKKGQWSVPVNMGPKINSGKGERFARLSPDGKYLFFGSFRNRSVENTGADIYWIDAKIIDELRKTTTAKTSIDLSTGTAILTALHKNERTTATELFKRWTLSFPGILDAKVIYSSLLRLNQQYKEAEQLFMNLPPSENENPKIVMERGLTAFGLNENETARKILESLLADKNDLRNRLNYLCDELFKMEKYNLSDEFFEKSIAIFSPNFAHYNRACAYALIGDKDKAFAFLNIAAEKGFDKKSDYENDADLVSLKIDSRWAILMQKLDAPFNGSAPYKRAHHEMVYDESSKSVLMIGGSTPINNGQSGKFFNDIWKYNSNGWSKIGNAGDERSGIRLAYDTKRNKIYSFGGFTTNNESSGQLRIYENGEWKILSDMPEMKAAEAGFVYDRARDRFIVFGGSAARGQVNNSTWEWDGTAWKKIEGKSPDGRQSFAMVYDSKRNKTILYGGADGNRNTFKDGVWEFDGTVWKNIVTEINPGERISPGYAFDSKRNLLILFGGISKGEMMNDLWAWDGKEWKLLSTGGPPKRAMGYLAYDKERDKVVLFGGRKGWPNDADDTWEWDGKKWNEVK
jgi:tetratricopeptide (TPR) repeat protein